MTRYRSDILSLLMLLLAGLQSVAQTCVLSGTVREKSTSEPVVGAYVNFAGSTGEEKTLCNAEGKFSIKVPRGATGRLTVSATGYKSQQRMVNCNKSAINLVFDLVPSVTELSELSVKKKSPLMTMRGDTSIYKMSAYHFNVDATALDVISQKMPGIGMRDGRLTGYGEDINEIKIDGREYYKGDVNMALKNLPAEVIDEIQLYDDISDYSRLTGIDDGNTRKVINIKTKSGIGQSSFGKAYGGYGLYDMYQLYGACNFFRNDMRISLFGQLNNTNEQNFSMLDLISATGGTSGTAPSQSPYSKGATDNSYHPAASDDVSSMLVDVSDYGVTTTRAFGTNFSDTWASGKIKYSGHYLYNSASNTTEYNIFDSYFGNTSSDNMQQQNVRTDNLNHRTNSKLEYNITDNDYIMVRPSLSYHKKLEDSFLTDWTVTPSDTTLLLDQNSVIDQYAVSSAVEIMGFHKFGRSGHMLTADARLSHAYTYEDISMDLLNHQRDDKALQSGFVKNWQKGYTYMLSYLCPVHTNGYVKLDAGYDRTYGTIRRRTEIKANDEADFKIDTLLCGSTWSNYGGLLSVLSYMYSTPALNIVAGTEFKYYNYHVANDIRKRDRILSRFLPFLFLRYRFNNSQLHFQYKTQLLFPAFMQLHDAINNTNAILAIRGNMNLDPAMLYSLTARLVMRLPTYNSVFVLFGNVEKADNYIGTRRSLASESFEDDGGDRRNTEIMSYDNVDGYFSWSTLIAYGFPVSFLGSNINLSSRIKYGKTPGFWDDNKQFTRTWNYNVDATLGSNISPQIDFVLDCNARYCNSANLNFRDMNVKYWSVSYGGQLNWQFLPSMKLVVEGGRTNYFGSGTSQFNAIIANAALGYKFLRDRRAELRFSIHDILNQDNSFSQTTTELYRREMSTNILGRYVMLTFTYNINTMKR